MTALVTGNPAGQPGPGADLDAAMLLAEVRESVLRIVAELPTTPARIRVTARDIAVELEWPAAGQPADALGPTAGAGFIAGVPAASPPIPPEGGHLPSGDQPAGDQPVDGHMVTAATVGTFYRAPEPGASPFVEAGDSVQAGQQLAIVEAMKLLLPVEADVSGRVRKVLKDDGQPVEFGEPLFVIDRD